MLRKIDEKYWNDYYRTHNERRFDDLVNGFLRGRRLVRESENTGERPRTNQRLSQTEQSIHQDQFEATQHRHQPWRDCR
jgi:hypothetical protein